MNGITSIYTDDISTIRHQLLLDPEVSLSTEQCNRIKTAIATRNFLSIADDIAQYRSATPGLLVTHDIDWLDPWHPYSLLNSFRSLLSGHKWLSFTNILNRQRFADQIAQLTEFEKESGIRSVYLFSGNNSSYRRFDIRYTLDATFTRQAIQQVIGSGHTIGLQTTARDLAQHHLMDVRHQLESVTGARIRFHRSHYLTYNPQTLDQVNNASLTYDLGFGNARKPGSISHYFGPFIENPNQSLIRIPMVITDNAFFVRDAASLLKEFREMIPIILRQKGLVNMNFHPENMLIQPALFQHFREIIHICEEEGLQLIPPSQLT